MVNRLTQWCTILLVAGAAQATPQAISTADTSHSDPGVRATAFTLLGAEHHETGQFEPSIRAFQQALQSDPDHAPGYVGLAKSLVAYGAAPMAVRVLRSYIRIETDSLLVRQAQQKIRELGAPPPPSPGQAVASSGFLGAEACAECHADRFEGFQYTAHHLTSRPATAESVLGSFAAEQNTLWTGNPDLWFEMTDGPEGLQQTANTFADQSLQQRSAPFDMVIGSGKIGQSFLHWRGDRLFQLPVSYLTESDAWINSPGYPDGTAHFDRPIVPRCLECHSTFFQSPQHDSNIHGRGEFVLGISCERCHGPGAKHVGAQRAAGVEGAPHITHPARLSRKHLIDLCAQCHSDTGDPIQEPFAFRPGDDIELFYAEPEAGVSGVHAANQVGRMMGSACYQNSDMTCVTCHDPHALERGNTKLFSQKCQSCHTVDVCAMGPDLGEAIADNCIDCHMPRRQDAHTQIQDASGALAFPFMPEHRVGIYPDATQAFLDEAKGQ